MPGARGRLTTVAMLAALAVALPARAGPVDWLHHKAADDAPRLVIAGHGVVALQPGEEVRVRIDADAPTAKLGDGRIRYLRFSLPAPLPRARIEVSVTTQRHRTSPRFTVLAPQLVILDGGGEIVQAAPLQPLMLDIEPFRRTRLRGCMEVQDLAGFLLATDPGRVGHRYEFDSRPKPGSQPDRGFYSARSSMRVFMRYAAEGEVLLRVVAASEADDAQSCQSAAG